MAQVATELRTLQTNLVDINQARPSSSNNILKPTSPTAVTHGQSVSQSVGIITHPRTSTA
jgi:hypothetical protein